MEESGSVLEGEDPGAIVRVKSRIYIRSQDMAKRIAQSMELYQSVKGGLFLGESDESEFYLFDYKNNPCCSEWSLSTLKDFSCMSSGVLRFRVNPLAFDLEGPQRARNFIREKVFEYF